MKLTHMITTTVAAFALTACSHFGTFKKSEAYNIYFEPGSAKVSSKGKWALKEVASMVKGAPMYDIRISGYTDKNGDHRMNRELSEKRKDAVRKALLDMGLDERSLKDSAWGEGLSHDQNKAADRRVRILVRKAS